MIGSLGENLTVLITTEPEKDWETFATWYSVEKNLPYARVVIVCHRNDKTPFQFLQWTKRLRIPTFFHNKFSTDSTFLNKVNSVTKLKLIGKILVIEPLTMILAPLSPETISKMNENSSSESLLVLDGEKAKEIIDNFILNDLILSSNSLVFEAKETPHLAEIVSYKKGCGKWINTSVGCPFSNAAGLISTDMTANERKVIELWKKLVRLYNVVGN